MSDHSFRPPGRRRGRDAEYLGGYGVEPAADPLDRWSDDVRRAAGHDVAPAGTGTTGTDGRAEHIRNPYAAPGRPATGASQAPRPTTPSGSRPGAPSASRWSGVLPGGAPSPGTRAARGLRVIVLVLLGALVVVPIIVLRLLAGPTSTDVDDPLPVTDTGAAPALPDVETAWTVDVADLSDIPGAEVRHSVDASFDEETILDVDGTWVVVVQDESSLAAELVALDPGTGETSWSRELSHATCARNPTADGLLACLEATGTDDAGLGTEWDLHLLDPATGEPTATTALGGHLTSVYVHAGAIVLLDQPGGGTDVVLRGLDAADLTPSWEAELGAETSDDMLAGDQRIITRGVGERGEAMLDRPRWRPVDGGLLAFSAGLRTAVVDVGSGELVMSPLCTRFATDGTTMWCNEDGAGMRAYDRAGAALWEDPANRMAATSALDPDARLTPLVLDPGHRLLDYDLANGRADSVLMDPGSADTFAGPLRPSGLVTDEYTVVRGDGVLVLLEPDRSGVVGEIPTENYPDGLLVDGDRLVVVGDQLTEADPATGAVLDDRRIPGAERTEQVGEALVAVRLDGLTRLSP